MEFVVLGGLTFLDKPHGHSHLCFMRRGSAILVAILCALSLSARSQTVVTLFKCDHDWSIHYGTNRYGLVQESWSGVPGAFRPSTITTIWLGSRSFSVN